eukprot:jgi/Bigna1/82054/fgenesh1_pg.87_\
MARKASESRCVWHSGVLTAVIVAVLAITGGAVGESLANVPVPRKGKLISMRKYAIDVDRLLLSRDHWPDVDENVHVAASKLAATFISSKLDATLAAFLEASAAATASRWGQVVAYAKQHAFWSLQRYLGWSWTDASAFMEMAKLHVASEEQLRRLLLGHEIAAGSVEANPVRLLDIGAGAGLVTDSLAASLNITDRTNVVCVENSGALRTILKKRGYKVVAPDEFYGGRLSSEKFAAVALLNLLDRCDEPVALLNKALGMLAPGGLLFIATVLPFNAIVHEGQLGSKWGKSSWRLPRSPITFRSILIRSKKSAFEIKLAIFLEAIHRHHPHLDLMSWTRLPYVSSGDTVRTHFALDSALMVFRQPYSDW